MPKQDQDVTDILKQMLSPEHIDMMLNGPPPSGFASEIPALAMENIFKPLWTRSGLDLRSRSILTLGILIALRAHEELMMHFPSAIRNGLSVEEIEEIIYHSTAYAGFPAGVSAKNAAEQSLRKAGMLP